LILDASADSARRAKFCCGRWGFVKSGIQLKRIARRVLGPFTNRSVFSLVAVPSELSLHADKTCETYTFERGAKKADGGDGWRIYRRAVYRMATWL